ncbi:MAG: Ig-like domain-containing protein [Clostridia bacterium]|nr:Ig-like domain-containing protein [Clostridia bacterium]
MKRILIPLLLLTMLFVSLSAAAEGNTMAFDRKVNTVFEGETLQTVLNRSGSPAQGEVTYVSSNQKVATVDEAGVVTGVSKGQATITATVQVEKKTYRAQLNVTVARKVTAVSVNTSRLAVYTADDPKVAGLLSADGDSTLPVLVLPTRKSAELKITVEPKDATNRSVTLSTTDETVARVRGSSITSAAPGETVVTVASASNPEVNTQLRVLVVQPVTGMKPTVKNPRASVGGQIALGVEVTPANATIPGIAWSSSDERLATVDADGVVTGLKRGTVRIIASATDGSGVRANISVQVVQSAEQITLDKQELTVDVSRTGMLTATVLPRDTNDKSVVWSSSDESIAKVSAGGRVTGVRVGSCVITCTSKEAGTVQATALVHVQQPVTKVHLNEVPMVFVNDTWQLSASVEPITATNPTLAFTSSKPDVLSVDEAGIMRGLKAGEVYVTATATDGSRRSSRIRVKVAPHATGVHMRRHTAYIDVGETATAGAVFEPENAGNKNMSWEIENTAIATVTGNSNQARITGRALGDTVLLGVTEDGGFQTSMLVKVGNWEKSLRFVMAEMSGKHDFLIEVKNVGTLPVSNIKVEITAFDDDNDPIAINEKNGSNVVTGTFKRTLSPGKTTDMYQWSFPDYHRPENDRIARFVAKIVSFQIDNDWVKTIRERNRPKMEYRIN